MRSRIAFYRDQAIDGLAELIQHPRMGALRWCVRRRPLVWVVPRRIAAGGAVIATTGAVMAAMVPAASAASVAGVGFHAPAGAPAPGDEAPHDKLPPFPRSQEKDETATKRKLFVWDNETKQSKLVEERTDGSILETTGESSDNGVGGEAELGGGKARRGGGKKAGPEGSVEGKHVWKSGSAETLQFKDKEQYDAYRARLRDAYRVAGREVDLGASDGSSQPGFRKKLGEETARIREEMRIPRITTESSGERSEGGASGKAWVVGGKYGANGEVLTEVSVNDNGTPDPGDDVRTETTKTSGSDVNLELSAGFEVDGAGGAGGTYKYVQNGGRAGSLVYENGKLVKFVQVKEQDWESGTEATGGPNVGEKEKRSGAGTAKTDTGTFDSGVTVIRTEVDLDQPGAKEALEAWRNAQAAYEEAGRSGDRARLSQASAALREAERNWGGYLENGTRVRAEYSRDAGSTSLGVDGCVRLVCGGFGLTQGNDDRRLLGTFYKDPATGQWRPYSYHNPGDLDGDGVDDSLMPNNVGPGSGNPNNDSSGGEADDPVIPPPGDPFPDFPEQLGLEGDPGDARDIPGSFKQDLPSADQPRSDQPRSDQPRTAEPRADGRQADQPPAAQDDAPERQDQRNSDEDSDDERSRPADRDDDSDDEAREDDDADADSDDADSDDADADSDDADSDSDSDDAEDDADSDEDQSDDDADDDDADDDDADDDSDDDESREDDSDDASDQDQSDDEDQSDDDSDDDGSDDDQSDDESSGDDADSDESDEDADEESDDDQSDDHESDDEDSGEDESDDHESDDQDSDDHDSDDQDSDDHDSDDHDSDDHDSGDQDSDDHDSDDHESDGGSGDDGSDDGGGDEGSDGGGDSDDGGDSGGGDSNEGGGQAPPPPAPEPEPAPEPPSDPEPAPAPAPEPPPSTLV